jgi:hypothetical protein
MPGLIELCAPHLVHALVIGATERHRRPEPNVEIVEIFQGSYQFLGVALLGLSCHLASRIGEEECMFGKVNQSVKIAG